MSFNTYNIRCYRYNGIKRDSNDISQNKQSKYNVS